MMMTLISDLDRTLVYSNQSDGICVEWAGKREMSFMTRQAYKTFLALLEQEDFQFIPCTARSRELAMRISFTQKKEPQFMICDHGGSIYVDGFRDKQWDYFLKDQRIINLNHISQMRRIVASYLQERKVPVCKITCNQNLFFVISFAVKEDAEKIAPILQKKFGTEQFRFYCQGRKLYYLPIKLNKSIAVQYLKESYGIQNIVTSGDSLFDEAFTALGNRIFLPAHATFHHPQAVRSKDCGIVAGEELIQYLKEEFEKY